MKHALPIFIALLATSLNALKPAAVDDTAYLIFAKHLSQHPGDPYGFEIFWYSYPQPAMTVLLPPVQPYWLSLGYRLFGDELTLLKLWLFPFALLLAFSVRSLLRRFAPDLEVPGLIAIVLSPAILPMFGAMLDVPALALGAAALALFIRAVDRNSAWEWFGAIVFGALAIQTKYSLLAVPAVVFACGISRGWRTAITGFVAAMAMLALAGCWEIWLFQKYGVTHFFHHLKDQSDGGGLWHTLEIHFAFAKPLLSQFGGLIGGISLLAAKGIGWPRWVRIGSALLLGMGILAIVFLPPGQLDLPFYFFAVCGIGAIVTVGIGVVRAVKFKRFDRATAFLMAWLFIETLGMLGMTPFPAARRTLGCCLAFAVLAMHLSNRLKTGGVAESRGSLIFAVSLGLGYFALDCWDAQPEKILAQRAAEMTRPQENAVYYTGHWGFQYNCEHAGMKPFVSNYAGHESQATRLKAGDFLVLPIMPDPDGFYRPWPPDRGLPNGSMVLEIVDDSTWLDCLSGQTIPNLYGGNAPLNGRSVPRLRVVVYRVLKDYEP